METEPVLSLPITPNKVALKPSENKLCAKVAFNCGFERLIYCGSPDESNSIGE